MSYCLSLMHRAKDLCDFALSALTQEEKAILEKELPEIADRFEEEIELFADDDTARWKRESQAIEILAKVKRGAYLQALADRPPRPAHLPRSARGRPPGSRGRLPGLLLRDARQLERPDPLRQTHGPGPRRRRRLGRERLPGRRGLDH